MRDTDPPVPGSVVTHFRIVEKLGAGGAGEVFRARDIHLGRDVALKFLTRTEDSEQQETILREARICASLLHPNIAIVHEIGWYGSIPFLVMELVEGEMLSRRIRKRLVTRQQANRYARQLLDALQEAHSRGVVHQDIKSSNIVVTVRDSIKILDFGLARTLFWKPGESETDTARFGTLEFSSPEQARGEDTDHRSDLFSAGVVLYHMFSGRLPFERETQVATYQALMKEHAVPLSYFMTDVPEGLDAVLQKALAKDPRERYQSAREFLEELESLSVSGTRRPSGPQSVSLAILYFDRIGDPEEGEFLRLGITEDIITDLSKVTGITVLSRHAVQKFREKNFDPVEAGRELKVHYLVHGTVQAGGGRIRITARLLDCTTGAAVWTERYDRNISDIFELQDEVARRITQALQIRLTDSEQRSLRNRSTADLQAYECYLRGRHSYNLASTDENWKAEEMLARAIRIDPAFAAAHAALAEVYVQRYYNWFDRDRKWLQKAEEKIDEAGSLNDRLPEVYCTRGQLLYLRGHYEEAMEEIQKSIRLDPHYVLAHDHTGEIYLHLGELDKAILAFHTEMRINPDVIYPYFYLIWIHSLLGEPVIAREVLEKAREKHSRNYLLHVLEGVFASYSGELSRAEQCLQTALTRNAANSFATGRLAVVYAEMQQWDRAVRMAELATEKIDPLDHHAAFDRACVLSLKGDPQNSIEWLHRAIELGWRCTYLYEKEKNLATARSVNEFAGVLSRLKS